MYNIEPLKKNFQQFLIEIINQRSNLPTLEVIQIGSDFASNKYIQFKTKKAKELGITVNHHQFHTTSNPTTIETLINQLNNQTGIIIQLPVPPKFQHLASLISPKSDIDLLSHSSQSLLHPTIQAIDLTLKDIFKSDQNNFEQFLKHSPDYSRYKIAVIGQGQLVGKPITKYFQDRNAPVIRIDEFTKKPKELTQSADIIVTAVGKPNLVDKSWLSPKAIIIDAATSESSGQLRGDLNLDNLHDSNIFIAPPKGIGSLTILSLFYNLLTI